MQADRCAWSRPVNESKTARVQSQTHGGTFQNGVAKMGVLWRRFASGRDRHKARIPLMSYFQEGLVVILVPASINTSRPL